MNKKEDEIKDTIDCFLDQFGSGDIYTQIVLEEFFRELFNEKYNIRLPSEKRQEGN